MRTIEKKIWPEYYEVVAAGTKKFELRLNDFPVEEGDVLVIREWDPKTKEYTGRQIEKTVGYVGRWKTSELTVFWTKEEIDEHGLQIISLL